MRLLIVEDELETARALQSAFRRVDILTDHAASLADATSMLECQNYDAITLDLSLPDGDGLEFLATLREANHLTPVVILTANGRLAERVVGLNHGADDYLTKPFAFEELLARLRAVTRRPHQMVAGKARFGRLTLDFEFREARVDGLALNLPRRELLVLEILMRRAGRIIPRENLMEAVFGFADDVQSNALDTHISRLRSKLAGADAGLVIQRARGIGYALMESTSTSPAKPVNDPRTRDAILESLRRVLNVYGYRRLTISQIAAEAGIPPSSFYSHFAGKPEATLELLENRLNVYIAGIPTAHDLPSFWTRELVLHIQHIELYDVDAGLLGCYFTYDTSAPAFAGALAQYTRRFLDGHILAIASIRPGCDLPVSALRPTLLALVSMTENMIFRHATARDPNFGLSGIELVHAILKLRFRGLFLTDPPTVIAISGTPLAHGPPLDNSAFAFDSDARRKDPRLTLQKIRQAALTLLDTVDYEDMRLTDIEEASGLTRGAVYRHYDDKRDLILSLVSERLAAISEALRQTKVIHTGFDGAYDTLRSLTNVFVYAFSASPALMKTLYHLEEVDPEFRTHYRSIRHAWAQLVGERIGTLCNGAPPVRQDIIAFAFLAMTDRFLYDIYSLHYDEFEDLRQNPSEAAHLLAVLWVRSLFLRNPTLARHTPRR